MLRITNERIATSLYHQIIGLSKWQLPFQKAVCIIDSEAKERLKESVKQARRHAPSLCEWEHVDFDKKAQQFIKGQIQRREISWQKVEAKSVATGQVEAWFAAGAYFQRYARFLETLQNVLLPESSAVVRSLEKLATEHRTSAAPDEIDSRYLQVAYLILSPDLAPETGITSWSRLTRRLHMFLSELLFRERKSSDDLISKYRELVQQARKAALPPAVIDVLWASDSAADEFDPARAGVQVLRKYWLACLLGFFFDREAEKFRQGMEKLMADVESGSRICGSGENTEPEEEKSLLEEPGLEEVPPGVLLGHLTIEFLQNLFTVDMTVRLHLLRHRWRWVSGQLGQLLRIWLGFPEKPAKQARQFLRHCRQTWRKLPLIEEQRSILRP
jgi:hypothetical protein